MNTKDIIKSYEDLGKKYIANISGRSPAIINDFMSLIPKGGLVLDVGCAGGRDSQKFIDAGLHVIGIDLVDEFLEYAKKSVPKAKFLKKDLLDLDFPDGYFDGIWANAVLLHVDKKFIPKVLDNFYRTLKPSGHIFIAVKEGEGAKYVVDKYSEGLERHFVYFKQSELRQMLETAGFNILSINSSPSSRPGITWLCAIASK